MASKKGTSKKVKASKNNGYYPVVRGSQLSSSTENLQARVLGNLNSSKLSFVYLKYKLLEMN